MIRKKSVQFYNATSLDHDMEYTLSTRTVDEAGNINETCSNSSFLEHKLKPKNFK